MPQLSSFDIVSQINLQEIDNAVNQAIKELNTRFDFKGSKSSLEFLKVDKKIRIIADDELKIKNIHDILKSRTAARPISQKALQSGEPEKAFEGTLRQEVTLIQGIPQDKAKEVVRLIKQSALKVQAAIQGEQVRVSSKSKDELQAVMAYLQAHPLDIPLQFTNYR